MSHAIENLISAQKQAMSGRPKLGGFPYMAEIFWMAGITKNIWQLPSCQSLYLTKSGPVMTQGTPLVTGMTDVPAFDQAALIQALREDQSGNSTFPQFLMAAWQAGVVSYEVDLIQRKVTYFGCYGEMYEEEYPYVQIG